MSAWQSVNFSGNSCPEPGLREGLFLASSRPCPQYEKAPWGLVTDNNVHVCNASLLKGWLCAQGNGLCVFSGIVKESRVLGKMWTYCDSACVCVLVLVYLLTGLLVSLLFCSLLALSFIL